MAELKTYGEIYDKDFLEKFGEYRDNIAKTKLEKEFEVDVENIAELCEIKVSYKKLDVSGTCILYHSQAKYGSSDDSDTRLIIINKDESRPFQRFTIAHELGHIILGHEGVSFMDATCEKYSDLIKRANELSANTFATELIMPEILLRDVIDDSIKNLGFDSKSMFSDADIDMISYYASNAMGVSISALKYRLKSLKVFR